jgi:hypothetical protein
MLHVIPHQRTCNVVPVTDILDDLLKLFPIQIQQCIQAWARIEGVNPNDYVRFANAFELNPMDVAPYSCKTNTKIWVRDNNPPTNIGLCQIPPCDHVFKGEVFIVRYSNSNIVPLSPNKVNKWRKRILWPDELLNVEKKATFSSVYTGTVVNGDLLELKIEKSIDKLRYCNGCGEWFVKTWKCGKCGRAGYCSKACQVDDWTKHRPECTASSTPPKTV